MNETADESMIAAARLLDCAAGLAEEAARRMRDCGWSGAAAVMVTRAESLRRHAKLIDDWIPGDGQAFGIRT